MSTNSFLAPLTAVALVVSAACAAGETADPAAESPATLVDVAERVDQYAEVTLDVDLGVLSARERAMIPHLIAAADAMDEIFWVEAFGDPDELLSTLHDPAVARYVGINYGPWDRLADNEPFLEGFGPKPPGANFYPADVTREEIESAAVADLTDPYTLVRRADDGSLVAVPYREAFAPQVARAAGHLRQAAALAEDPGLSEYLQLRATALESDDYQPSDLAWMDMIDNSVDVVIGPIETYEDQLLGVKTAHEAYVLLKDREWSARLARYAELLPGLQRGLPVDERYKREEPGSDAQLGAYDLVYVAGDGGAGSKTIAINLPNDEQVQLEKGTRRLQIKNAMRAKFDTVLAPIADALIAPDQRRHVTFDAFFANTMFHEVAHGLGIKNTVDGTGTVRAALQEQASWLEEGKADILGLYMITALHESGELGDVDLMDNYVTFFASVFRSIRFGAASAHGRANLVRFNFFAENGAFDRDDATGTYRVDFDAMRDTMTALSRRILTLQGDGDREGVAAMWDQMGVLGGDLQAALDALTEREIPVDIVYRQGSDVLGLDAE